MLVSAALRLGDIMYLILMLEICIITVIVKGRVLLEIPSMHKLVQYFQTLHRNEDIYELKGVHIATFESHLFSSNVEHCSVSNVNSYQCSCKQCCPIAVYAMCYITLLFKSLWIPDLTVIVLESVSGAKSCGQPIWLKLGTEVGCDEIFQKPLWLTSLTFSFGVKGGLIFCPLSTKNPAFQGAF